MAISPVRLNVGKIRATGAVHAWEPSYVASVRGQLDELQNIMKDIIRQIGDAAPIIVKSAMEPTYLKSQLYCPVDTGRLRGSGYLEIVGFRGQPRVEMGYAKGGNPWYAVVVHENLEFHHASPTRARWLAAAVEEDLVIMQDNIKRGMQEFWDSGSH